MRTATISSSAARKTSPRGYTRAFRACPLTSGFVEFGETLEDAVRREALEETGVDVGKVVYHTSLPFPMPANLLIGAFAFAEHSRVRCDLDAELEDAFFAPRADVLAAVRVSETGSGSAPMRNGAPY